MKNEKQKGIIEKLGITPLKSYLVNGIETVYETEKIRELEKRHNEMLEALITSTFEMSSWSGGLHEDIYLKNVNVIQKTTGKSREEIKELL